MTTEGADDEPTTEPDRQMCLRGTRRSARLHRGRRHDSAIWSLPRPEREQPAPKSWELSA
jgi:hypothetical protein